MSQTDRRTDSQKFSMKLFPYQQLIAERLWELAREDKTALHSPGNQLGMGTFLEYATDPLLLRPMRARLSPEEELRCRSVSQELKEFAKQHKFVLKRTVVSCGDPISEYVDSLCWIWAKPPSGSEPLTVRQLKPRANHARSDYVFEPRIRGVS